MKTISLLLLVLIENACAFLTYPFAGDLLGRFLDNFVVDDSISLQHMDHGEKCNRECKENDVKVCRFLFMMKYYEAVGGACANCTTGNLTDCLDPACVLADGVKRGFLSINFQLPSPSFHVCKNDVIVVDLTNEAEGVATTIHWHGFLQHNTQFMDGVPYVTQCPIAFGSKFRYAFRAEDEGTHFYHAHAGHQKANGIYGAIIVRAPEKNNPNAHLYDFDLPEHLIMASDWMHHLAEEDFPGMVSRSVLTESLVINGLSRFYNKTSESYTFGAWKNYNVEPKKRYRFRYINSGFNVCPFMLQIEDHMMTMISTEVSYVKPFKVDSLYSIAGERFDFVIETDKEPKDYWIRVKVLYPCREQIEAFAILHYTDNHEDKPAKRLSFTEKPPPRQSTERFPEEKVFNSPLPKVKDIPLIKMDAYEFDKSIVESEPDHQFYLFLDSPTLLAEDLEKQGNYYRLSFSTTSTDFNSIGTFNNISLKYPSYPLVTQLGSIDESIFCNENTTAGHHCFQDGVRYSTSCRCTHNIKLKLNSNVELILVNIIDQIAHPIHLHGHKFHIMDMGIFEPEQMDPQKIRNGAIPKTSQKRPPYKDTVVLPYPGYVRLRFRADNPGFWLMHCHFDWHLTTGMSVIFQVGELEDIAKIPVPEDFPKCDSFTLNKIHLKPPST